MPELPEVETTLRGISPLMLNQSIVDTVVRQRQLRWPLDKNLAQKLRGQKVLATRRRGKYLVLQLTQGELILHLGMSGSMRWVERDTPPQKHDHVDWIFSNQQVLRFTDPRRFGAIVWTDAAAEQHPLLKDLGPEPLAAEFNVEYLFQRSRKRKQAIKSFVMDNKIVVGVGNIYANEALFQAGIRPGKAAGRVTKLQYLLLVAAIKKVLSQAIKAGGTTLKDFVGGDGKPGYFKQELQVYGREGLPCLVCEAELKLVRIGQRASTYCPQCQS